jgi:hypothetical protein
LSVICLRMRRANCEENVRMCLEREMCLSFKSDANGGLFVVRMKFMS